MNISGYGVETWNNLPKTIGSERELSNLIDSGSVGWRSGWIVVLIGGHTTDVNNKG